MANASLKDYAREFKPEQTKNIADLPEVNVNVELLDGEGIDKDDKPFKYKYIEVNGEKYRVPGVVLGDLKAILEKKPELKTFSVTKKGEGLKTRYTVIPQN